LLTEDNNQYSLLWKILLKITKVKHFVLLNIHSFFIQFLIPHFLNYIKFDRLRFLVQVIILFLISQLAFSLIKGKDLKTSPIFNDLRLRFPSVNFERLLTQETDRKQENSNETDTLASTNLLNCGDLKNNLLESTITNQFYTTEKSINTDEQCEFRTGERFPPLTETELEQELRQFCTKFEWKDVENVLGESFDAPINLHQADITVNCPFGI
jgi:hypothetical protein